MATGIFRVDLAYYYFFSVFRKVLSSEHSKGAMRVVGLNKHCKTFFFKALSALPECLEKILQFSPSAHNVLSWLGATDRWGSLPSVSSRWYLVDSGSDVWRLPPDGRWPDAHLPADLAERRVEIVTSHGPLKRQQADKTSPWQDDAARCVFVLVFDVCCFVVVFFARAYLALDAPK